MASFFGFFCSLLGHHLPLPLGNFNPTGIMAGDLFEESFHGVLRKKLLVLLFLKFFLMLLLLTF